MFRLPLTLLSTALLLGAVGCSRSDSEDSRSEPDARLFELRVYHPFPGKLAALNERFRDHTTALFEKQGMENIGYWVTEEEDPKLVYLLAFSDEAAREAAWKGFSEDPDWQAAYAASIEDGRLVERIDSTLLRRTDYSPPVPQERREPGRKFELRTYRASEGNLGNLDERFRSATMDLFRKHGGENLMYFHVQGGEAGDEDTLVYFLAYPSAAARDAMWEAFRSDPDWVAAKAASEAAAGGSLTQAGGVSWVMLEPTDYSRIR